MNLIKIHNLAFKYHNSNHVFHSLDFEAENRETIALLGPSGCGKTTLMKLVAGILVPDKGTVLVDSKNACEQNSVGYIPQDRQFMPWLNVIQNIKFPKATVSTELDTLIDSFQIEPILDKRPHNISGGQLARAATVRGILRAKRVLLMDEPLSSVDPVIRHKLWLKILSEISKRDLCCIFTTHDIREALAYATRIVIIGDTSKKNGSYITSNIILSENKDISEATVRDLYELGNKERLLSK